MAMEWKHLGVFVLLNIARFYLKTRTFTSLKAYGSDPDDTAALGYEASWAGVFQNPGK